MARITLNSDLLLHNTSGPAVDDGDIQIWFVNGIIHRDGGPALIIKSLDLSYYYSYGRYHNDDGPALTANACLYMSAGTNTRDSSTPPTDVVMSNYILHSIEQSTAVCSDNINIWMSFGKLHRVGRPAIIIRTSTHKYSAHYNKGIIIYTSNTRPTNIELYTGERTRDISADNHEHSFADRSWWDNIVDAIVPNFKKNYERLTTNTDNTEKCCNCGDDI